MSEGRFFLRGLGKEVQSKERTSTKTPSGQARLVCGLGAGRETGFLVSSFRCRPLSNPVKASGVCLGVGWKGVMGTGFAKFRRGSNTVITPFKTHHADFKIEGDRGKIEEDRGRSREREEIEENRGRSRKIEEKSRKIEERSRRKIEKKMKIEENRGRSRKLRFL